MEATEHDAAFGPVSGAVGDAVTPPTPLAELQGLLNLRGYGPVVVNGQWDEATQAAARAAGMAVSAGAPTAQQLQQAITLLKAPAASAVEVDNRPWFKQPKYLLMAAAGLAVVGYVAWRAGAFDDDEAPEPKPEQELNGPEPKRKRNLPPPKEKCSIVPDVEGAAPVPPPEGV